MFVAVYEFEIRDGCDAAFKQSWLKLTQGIYLQSGSLGSRLHKAAPTKYVGYAQWPNKATWRAAKDVELEPIYSEALAQMRKSLVSSKTVYELDIVADYLHSHPFEVD